MKNFFEKTDFSQSENPQSDIPQQEQKKKISPANDKNPARLKSMSHSTSDHLQSMEEFYETRNLLLQDIDYPLIRRAWFTLSHLLLDEHAHIIDMGCDDGAITFAMAVLAPNMRFTGVDKNKRLIKKAQDMYGDRISNLDFVHGDITKDIMPPESVDAIINNDILHEVYSSARYSESIIRTTMAQHYKMLKSGGTLFIRDFARPPPEDYVMIELPDEESFSDDLYDLSEADLLVWYSEHARPRQDADCGGFFLEELPPRRPRTRLFRLPYKWAYEFVLRKDNRETWEKDLPVEYTFYTPREFRKELRALGMRVQYSAPYWDEDIIEERFEGKFRLYESDGTALGHPPTCYISVSKKLPERRSLYIAERRPAMNEDTSLKVYAMRNEETGKISDVVKRDITPAEILPFHITDEGRLKIYLHDGIPRGVANAVPRNGINIDDKRWSGHMIESLSVDVNTIYGMDGSDMKSVVKFSRDYLGLKPQTNAILVHGPDYYPAPDYIDEKIETYYIEVQRSDKPVVPKHFGIDRAKFQAKGDIHEYDAQQVLNAISVGLIPHARLELQILSLFEHLGLQAETWTNKDVQLQRQNIGKKQDTAKLLHDLAAEDKRFKEIKGTVGDLRPVNSIFVEEGQNKGSLDGLNAQNINFIVSDEKTINTAVVIPLTSDLEGTVHAGFNFDFLPVPQRHEGSGATMKAPSFNIPKDVKTIKQIKKFVADQFDISPDSVLRLGESYFNHIGLTQQRIYPFAIATPAGGLKDPNTQFIPIHQFRLLWRALSKDTHMMVVLARAYQFLHSDIKNDYKMRVKNIVKERFEGKVPDWSVPITYVEPPGKKEPKPGNNLDLAQKNAPATSKKPQPSEIPAQQTQSPATAPPQQGKKQQQQPTPAPTQISASPAEPASPPPPMTAPLAAHPVQPDTVAPDSPATKMPPAQKPATPEQTSFNRQNAKADTANETSDPVDTNIALSDDFAELEELAEAVENTLPLPPEPPKPERW